MFFVVSQFRHLFFLGGSCDLGAIGVMSSACFVRGGRTPKGCCLVERGLCYGEATDTLGGFCRMVTSSVVGLGAGLHAGEGVKSSHSTRFKVKALCLCIFGGVVGGVGAGFRAGDGGESGVASFHSTWVKVKVLCHCTFCGGVGDVGAH